jgi:TldD protein
MITKIETAPILKALATKNSQLAEIFLEESKSLSIVMDNGRMEKVLAGTDRGAGLRLIHDFTTSYSHTNQVHEKSLLPLAQNLAAMAGENKADIKPPAPLKPGLTSTPSKPFQNVETRLKTDLVREAEAAARSVDPRIRQARVIYMDKVQRVRIANSLGADVYDERNYLVFLVHCVAEENGVMQTGYELIGGMCGMELFDAEDPRQVAKEAARRAIQTLTARPAPGGSMPVVLAASAGGTMIHEAVGHGLEADHINENMSVYAGKVGERVASPLITVVDDGTIKAKRGSFAFDDEGEPSKRNVLIENGVLKSYMHDRLSALKMGKEPTGNGRRENYEFAPVPRMTNTMIMPGKDDPESIIKDTPQGLLVSKMGGGQVNPVNGDFVFEVAEGYLIKDGQVKEPVRGATLTGNGPQVLQKIDRLGKDLGYGVGTCGKDGQGAPVADAQPTLRIPSMVVGGQQNA